MSKSRSTEWDRPELLRHLEAARGLARRLLRDASEADDVSQDAAAIALTKGGGEVQSPWLYGVVRNLVMQRDRQSARRQRREREAARGERAADQGDMLAAVESHRRLIDHVLALDEQDRDVLLWRYFRGETPAQIALKEGRTVAAVGNQLTRAHRSLRQRLEVDGGKGHWMGGLAPLAASGGTASKGSPLVLGAALLSSGALKATIAGAAAFVCAALYWLLPLGQGGAPPGPAVKPPTVASAPDETDKTAAPERQDPVGPDVAADGPSRVAANAPAVEAVSTAALRGHLQEARGFPLEAPRVTLRAQDGRVYAPPSGSGVSPTWAEVPHSVPLDVMLEVDGTPWPTPIAKIRLAEGADESLTWTVHAKTIVRGVAVDENGSPLAEQLVNLHRSWQSEACFPGEIEESSDMGTTLTDEAGRFVLSPVLPGTYQLMGVNECAWVTRHEEAADGRVVVTELDGWIKSKARCSLWTQPLVIPFNAPSAEPLLVLYTGGKLQGQLVSEVSGDLISGQAAVQIQSLRDDVGFTYGETTGDGQFTSPPLPPGRFKLDVQGPPSGWIPGSPVEASAGDSDVRLLLMPAATVKVRIDTGAASLSGKGRLRAKAIHPETMWHQPQVQIEAADPSGSFTTLAPGEYAFLFTSNDGALAGLIAKADLGPGDLPGGLVLKATATATIEVKASDEVLFVTASVEDVEFDLCRVRPGQTGKMRLPAGPITLRITRGEEEKATERALVLKAGEAHSVE